MAKPCARKVSRMSNSRLLSSVERLAVGSSRISSSALSASARDRDELTVGSSQIAEIPVERQREASGIKHGARFAAHACAGKEEGRAALRKAMQQQSVGNRQPCRSDKSSRLVHGDDAGFCSLGWRFG